MKQKKKLLLTACVGGVLSVIWLAASLISRDPLTSLIRPENGKGDRKEKLEVWIGEEPYSMEVTVRERPKTEAETTAPPIPAAVSVFLETPKNGQIPRN